MDDIGHDLKGYNEGLEGETMSVKRSVKGGLAFELLTITTHASKSHLTAGNRPLAHMLQTESV